MNNDNPKAIDAGQKGVRLLFSSYVQWTDFILACAIIAFCGILYAVTYSFDQIPTSLSRNLPVSSSVQPRGALPSSPG